MLKNIELTELWMELSTAGKVVLFPHVNPDGDAVGACSALCRALREAGTDCTVCSGKVPDYLDFADTEFFSEKTDGSDPDICVAVDCSEEHRLDRRAEFFRKGRRHFCIDHHENETGFGEKFYINPDAPATCSIIFEILKAAEADITNEIANSIYMGLSTDTGNFKYSNTDSKAHMIAAELLEIGVKHDEIMTCLYQNRSIKKLRCESKAVGRAIIFAEGRGIMSYLSGADLAEMDATSEDADEIIDRLRDISGVEMAAYLEERENGIKISMRAKTCSNVNDICRRFGGGGHVKAAGATLNMSLEDAFAAVKHAMEEAL